MPRQTLGPQTGTLRVFTFRDGVAARVGHDLVLEVGRWSADVVSGQDGAVTALSLDADSGSLTVLEGRNGLKPLSEKDRRTIVANVDDDVLKRRAIRFVSSSVQADAERLTASGTLTIGDADGPASFELRVADGHVSGRTRIDQTAWGLQPYRGFFGALKVADEVEISVDARLSAA